MHIMQWPEGKEPSSPVKVCEFGESCEFSIPLCTCVPSLLMPFLFYDVIWIWLIDPATCRHSNIIIVIISCSMCEINYSSKQ